MSTEEQFDFYWKEIFAGLPYNPIEFNVYRFDQSMSLPGKLNKLYDMFKVLAMNNQEVMDYLKEFVETFDARLYNTIEDVLEVMLEDGRLADIVRVAINDEVIEARTDYLGKKYVNLKERLDSEKAESLSRVNEIEADITEVTTQLTQTEMEIEDIAISLVNFPRNEGETDDSGRIERAIAYGNVIANGKRRRIILPEFILITRPIAMPTTSCLVGSGKYVSIIQLSNSFIGASAIKLETDETYKVQLENFSIRGNRDNLTNPIDGINFTNKDATWNIDPYHLIRNVYIENMSGNGVYMYGRGESIVDGVQVKNVNKNGFFLHSFDSWFTNLSSGLCGESAFDIGGGPHRIANSKGWGSKIGFKLTGVSHNIVGCESQENRESGLIINGNRMNISMTIDSVGYDFVNKVVTPNATAIVINSNYRHNMINATVTNRLFETNNPNSLKYAIKCLGFFNTININGEQFETPIDPSSDFNSNNYRVVGAKAYELNKGSYFVNPTNKDGVFVGGSIAEENVGVLRAVNNGTQVPSTGVDFRFAEGKTLFYDNIVFDGSRSVILKDTENGFNYKLSSVNGILTLTKL